LVTNLHRFIDPLASSRISNYLRAHRKRLGLSQGDVAFLLGDKGSAKVCRHERYSRGAKLETALAYEVIFGIPASELFAGLFQRVAAEVSERAGKLAARKAQNPGRGADRHQAVLTRIHSKPGGRKHKQSK
jgi:hypothetical protein